MLRQTTFVTNGYRAKKIKESSCSYKKSEGTTSGRGQQTQLSADDDIVFCVAEHLVQSVGSRCQTDIRKDLEKEAE